MDTSATASTLNWNLCIFCQRVSRERITYPGLSKRPDVGSGYKRLCEAFEGFKEVGSLPSGVNFNLWDEGDGLENTFKRHNAGWHKQCRNLLHSTALDRLRKRIQIPSEDDPDLLKERQQESDEEFENPSKIARITRATSGFVDTAFTSLCFFCAAEGKDNKRKVMTKPLTDRVQKCAEIIKDHNILAKLAQGDLVALEAQYHPSCLLAFYDKASRLQSFSEEVADDPHVLQLNAESLALADVIGYIEDVRFTENTPSVFTLRQLKDIYLEQLKFHGVGVQTNSTRFKERLLENCPDLSAVPHGRDVLLTFSNHLGIALKHIRENSDRDAVHLMHAVKLIRNDIFQRKDYNFTGSFDEDSQRKSVPQMLVSLIGMLLEGPGYCNDNSNQAALSISQLITFNAVKRPRATVRPTANAGQTHVVRHLQSQETPLPIYMGLMLHSATRKKKLIDRCFTLGLSISYDRVLQITNKLGNSVCQQFNTDQLVCPPVLKGNLFTVAAVDNIDHNPHSETAKSSFHGTAISLMQFPTADNAGVDRFVSHPFESASNLSSDIVLPLVYSDVLPCVFPKSDPIIPMIQCPMLNLSVNTAVEYEWLNVVMDCIQSNSEPENISWAGYLAEAEQKESQPLPVIAMLPLFRHSANTVAMIRHSFTVIQAAVNHLNSNQVPVITFDQPLYALAKQIQWHWPEKFGEDKFVVMMGGLHIEMAALKMLGQWLDGSGWVQCLIEAGVATSGVVESFIHASHVKRTRYAHTVTAAALYICQRNTYSQYCSGVEEEDRLPFLQWRSEKEKTSSQFRYWNMVLDIELLVLTLIRSIREGNFDLYVNSIRSLLPWFFSLDHTHYARWMSVHLRDMSTLRQIHPGVASEFEASHFTISKCNRKFSNISIDQAHEQLNALIKGDGGAVGLTESDTALSRWVIAGPEVIRILQEFEGNINPTSKDRKHHEQRPSYQKRYKADVKNLMDLFYNMGNVFNETDGDDLVSLDTHTLADKAVCTTVTTASELGNNQMENFFKERLQGKVSILEPLHRNKLPLFTFKPASKERSASQLKVAELKTDCDLFSRLYIACQSRNGDLNEFFRHENQALPPSLSQNGTIRFGTKSNLLACLCSLSNTSKDLSELTVDTCILDGAVIVQMLQPGCSRTFKEYSQKIFLPYIESVLQRVQRLDVVFDIYVQNSLKSATRVKRGSGKRLRVVDNTIIPKNWQEFLRVNENKTELFHFLADGVVGGLGYNEKKTLVTYDDRVRCVGEQLDVDSIDPCNHEEADMRLILHCYHAAENGSRKVAIRTVDTDVVVLAVAFFHKLNLEELWVHFGTGRTMRLIAAHELSKALGPTKCLALPVFHCLTGCDTTSSFGGRGKKTAWETWNAYPVVTEAFLNLNSVDDCLDDATLSVLERFIIIMYDRTSECTDLNAARMNLFTKKSRSLELLPPTSDAFLQHVKRSIYQAVHCWGHCLEKQVKNQDPGEWGWVKDGKQWVPLWMTIPEVSKICSELIHCACKKGCLGRCKCVKANLVCTALCQCDGECVRE